uniref:Uncharacterized protein n=1 Tax=Rhizobium rhizogenes TaxID=359 RepID=A0A7S5DQP8_RHIRH|nr:hypothetical protein pC5.7c_621 [Rhizobium rhizogenes]QCL09969.1 hypothetical protein pC5.8b_479 [Rhizobium rhizogenes]
MQGIQGQAFGCHACKCGASDPAAQRSAWAAIETTLPVSTFIVERG